MYLDRYKNYGCGQKKKQNALALLYLATGPLPNAANSSDVTTELAELNTTKMTPRRQISELELLTFHQKDNRVFFELFLSIYTRHELFFLKFKTSTLSNTHFATLVAQKHSAISRQEKMTFSSPRRVASGLPPALPQLARAFVRWNSQ